MLEGFQAFNIQSIPRRENKYANRLATIGTQYDVPKYVVDAKEKHIRLVVRPNVLENFVN